MFLWGENLALADGKFDNVLITQFVVDAFYKE